MPRLPAAATQKRPAPNMSERYGHIDTAEIILCLGGKGWVVDRADAAQPYRGGAAFAKHRVVFRKAGKRLGAGLLPELVFINSHDGSSGARFHQGLYREVCANAIITDGMRRTRHCIAGEEALIDAAGALIESFAMIGEQIARRKARRLSAAEQEEFARLGAQLRYGDGWIYDPAVLLAARRAEDAGDDLWSTYNRLHENFIRGGFRGCAVSGQAVTALPLSCIERDAKFNVQFWQLAGEML